MSSSMPMPPIWDTGGAALFRRKERSDDGEGGSGLRPHIGIRTATRCDAACGFECGAPRPSLPHIQPVCEMSNVSSLRAKQITRHIFASDGRVLAQITTGNGISRAFLHRTKFGLATGQIFNGIR
eukprot:722488-Prorocentrum_minimum.AAC.5